MVVPCASVFSVCVGVVEDVRIRRTAFVFYCIELMCESRWV